MCGSCEGPLSGLIGGIVYSISFIGGMLIQLLTASTYFLLGKIKTNNLISIVRRAKPKVI